MTTSGDTNGKTPFFVAEKKISPLKVSTLQEGYEYNFLLCSFDEAFLHDKISSCALLQDRESSLFLQLFCTIQNYLYGRWNQPF